MIRIGFACVFAAFLIATAGTCASATPDTHKPSNAVIRWNEIGQSTIEKNAPDRLAQFRDMALLQVAVYDSVESIKNDYRTFAVHADAAAGASPDAAASSAARRILALLFPAQKAALDAEYGKAISATPRDGREAGAAVGDEVARKVYLLRQLHEVGAAVTYAPAAVPGQWVATPPKWLPALRPELASVKTWLLTSSSQLRPGPPPALDSALYLKDLAEVAALGSATSAVRTADQAQAAVFWQRGGPGYWNDAARQVSLQLGTSLSENARLFAALNLALADAIVASWDSKYHYGFWRPLTAVRASSVDYKGWTPVIDTPPFPEYVAAHSIASGAAAGVLDGIFGTGPESIALTSSYVPGATRRYTSADDLAAEISNARVWGGVHFRNSCEVGERMGRQIARIALERLSR